MNNSIPKMGPSGRYPSLVKKYRKVQPVDLQPQDTIPSVPREALAAGLEKYTGDLDRDRVAHLLKRTLFGVTQEEVSAFAGLSLDEGLSRLIVQGEPPAPPVNDYNDPSQGITDPHVAAGETWVQAPFDLDIEGQRTLSIKNWLIEQIKNQEATIEEKLLFFWHNLLPTKAWDVFHGRLIYRYFEMLRRNAFGNFKTMVRELTLDPAMLMFLNGAFNHKDAPDENYARELQELFCIGKGPNAGYTEADIQAAARVLTGWQMNWDMWDNTGDLIPVFVDWAHDAGDKTFSSFYGNKVIEGKSGQDGADELDELLDMIFDQAETARYVCRRLYTFFVYHEIDATTETNIIEPLAELFRSSGYEIVPVIEKLLSSAHFFDAKNIGSMIKNPLDFNMGLWKLFDHPGLGSTDRKDIFDENSSSLWRMANQGLELADPPSVSGWPAYYQAPSFDKYWITTDTITDRGLYTDSLLYWGIWLRDEEQAAVDLVKFLQTLETPEDPNRMLREASILVHGNVPSDDTFDYLKTILLSGQDSDGYWTQAWLQLQGDPFNEEYRAIVENRLKATFRALLQLGETNLF